MIDLKEVTVLLEAYAAHYIANTIHGVYMSTSERPKYISEKNKTHNLCKYIFESFELRKSCRKFYEDLQFTETATSICPYGFNLTYCKHDMTARKYGLFIQTGFHASELLNMQSQNLPRIEKKRVRQEVEIVSVFEFGQPRITNFPQQFIKVIETIISGRVAAAMRALTHELLSPIQGAMNDVEIIYPRHGSAAPETIIKLKENILSCSDIAKKIQILLSENLQFKQNSLRKMTVHKVVNSICNKFRQTAKDKYIDLKEHFNSGTLFVEAIPDQIEIALSCIIENAVKYSFDGFPDAHGRIDIKYKDNDKFLEISVSSFGCPITPQEINEKRLFELGYRGVYSCDRNRKGTGSGLFIADRIVRSHSGSIAVISKIVEGSGGEPRAVNTFTVIWPFYQAI